MNKYPVSTQYQLRVISCCLCPTDICVDDIIPFPPLLQMPSGFIHLIWWSVENQQELSRTDRMKKKMFFKKRRRVGGSSFRFRIKAKPICLNYCGPHMRKLHNWFYEKTTWVLRSKSPEFKFFFCYSLALWNDAVPSHVSYLVCKMEIMKP